MSASRFKTIAAVFWALSFLTTMVASNGTFWGLVVWVAPWLFAALFYGIGTGIEMERKRELERAMRGNQ